MSNDFEIAIEEGATMVRIGGRSSANARSRGSRQFGSERSAGILEAMPRYSAVSARAGFPEAELEILELWQRNQSSSAAWRCVATRRPTSSTRDRPLQRAPGLHHVLARSYKDVLHATSR